MFKFDITFDHTSMDLLFKEISQDNTINTIDIMKLIK